ncbi:hypothetical protein A2U01_0016277, partial [Trifolium medium]|nr:hypothetical protein [Trifolium medium]
GTTSSANSKIGKEIIHLQGEIRNDEQLGELNREWWLTKTLGEVKSEEGNNSRTMVDLTEAVAQATARQGEIRR